MPLEYLIFLTLFTPALVGVLNLIFHKNANVRDGVTLLGALVTFYFSVNIFLGFDGQAVQYNLVTIMPGINISFHIEPLGIIFSLLASSLWILTHIYAIGYMRGAKEKKHSRFFLFFSVSIASVMGISFSGNLFTLFLFYELLTLITFPLVSHKGSSEALRGARVYLSILLGTSIGLQLLGIIWIYFSVGTLDFVKGGILNGSFGSIELIILVGLFAFGIGKAALFPFHKWLPAAMVAPTPVSALLHAVAVVKAGVFTVLKVGVYTFGVESLSLSGATDWLTWLACFSLLFASLIAMTKDNLKARLAYSTISQLAYVVLAFSLANSLGILGGALQIVTHAFGKITLFMCAGSIYVATKKTNISDMQGLGRVMPITFLSFLFGAISIIGLPPMGGSWAKWFLIMASLEADKQFVIIVLLISSLLNIAYLLPLVARGFYLRAGDQKALKSFKEPSAFIWLPPAITASISFLLFFYVDYIRDFMINFGLVG
ncbi:MAG: proton-conducting transporter membrane subunit [Paracoccaceae bacterium]